jgi:ribonucleoside-triphosphate reductase (formate)
MIYLVTTPSCPNCPAAKKLVEEKGIKVEYIDASVEEGLHFAREHGISSVPSLIIVSGEETKKCIGTDETLSYLNQLS